jgi:hypothetical protein
MSRCRPSLRISRRWRWRGLAWCSTTAGRLGPLLDADRRAMLADELAAQQAFADHAIVVLGEPEYYGRFGFAPADLASPYAGPYLLATGCAGLPSGSRVAHAPAFSML